MATVEPIPAGFWRDADGRLIPENLIKPIDKERDALVTALTRAAKEMSEALARFKAKAFGDIGAFVELSAEQYGVKLGGKKGNVTLMSFDGRYKVIRQIQEHLVFDERLQAAKALIDECIQAWTEGSRDEIKALINDAFQVNKEGKINTGRVLGLKRLDIRDERWQRAMQAIGDSVQVAGSKPYFRVYERVGDTDQYQAISLDIAGV
jgi:hypothetical protein